LHAGVTGIPGLDRLVHPAPPGWIVEFYGDWRLVDLIAHHAAAQAAARGKTVIVHVQEFGGLNPYLLARLARARRGTPDNILIARAFRAADIPRLVGEAARLGADTIIVYDPYLYTPRDPARHHTLTPITAAIRGAAQHATRILLFNRHTPQGRRPRGGHYHHHTTHIITRITRWSKGIAATLIKHPARATPATARIRMAELAVTMSWGGQRPLTEYL